MVRHFMQGSMNDMYETLNGCRRYRSEKMALGSGGSNGAVLVPAFVSGRSVIYFVTQLEVSVPHHFPSGLCCCSRQHKHDSPAFGPTIILSMLEAIDIKNF